jgi:hypothetical protein
MKSPTLPKKLLLFIFLGLWLSGVNGPNVLAQAPLSELP